MATRGYLSLAAILIAISLDTSVVVVVAAAVAWDPQTSRYEHGGYNLDRGPVFYEAYYPDPRDVYQEKRYSDLSAMLERSFQVPIERFASDETAERPASSNESFVVSDNEEPRERRKVVASRRDYNTADKTGFFQNERFPAFLEDDENPRGASVEEISKLVRRAISSDLENWNALEKYLDGTRANRGRPIAQPAVDFTENRKTEGSDSYSFPVNRQSPGPSAPSSFEVSRKLADARQRPDQFADIGASGTAMTSATSDGVIATGSPPPPSENIFQPRPQLIRYVFFRKPAPRFDVRTARTIDNSTPRSYGDNLIREEIAADSGGGERAASGNVKVTSIEVSELPRHKTRHHHGEWPKRDYSARGHHS